MISQLVPGKRPGRRRQAPGGFREHEAPRTQDLEFRAPERGRDVSEIEPPPGFTADELAEPVNADVGYPAYLGKRGTAGHTICYSRLFEVRELSVPVAKAGELRKFFRSIFADESMSAVLKETRHQSRSATARVGVRRHCGEVARDRGASRAQPPPASRWTPRHTLQTALSTHCRARTAPNPAGSSAENIGRGNVTP